VTWRRVLLAALAVACVLLPALALARAGGGGGFSGGGGGGFSGGGGGGEGAIVRLLIWLIIRKPAIGIPATIIVVVVFVASGRMGRSAHVSRTIRRGYEAQSSQSSADGFERLRRRDPAFDADEFLERCKLVFPKVQDAWGNQDMTPARHLVSDGIYERFQLQLAMYEGALVRNTMEDVRVLSARVAGVESDDFFDTLHVRIGASAVDYWTDIRGGKRIHGSRSPESFAEVWSFLRRPGARTLAHPGLLEGYCPNCGAALEVADSVQCSSCRAVVNSGQYDWVLAEITQAEVWAGPAGVAVPGLTEMSAKDAAFNVQHIEDRASVVFWRLRTAEFFASDTYLKKLALPDFLAAHAADYRPREDGTHRFFADAAVGSVEVAAVEPAGDGDELDRVHVHVKWSGHREEERVPSPMKPAYERSQFRSQDFVLVRRKGVKTAQGNTLTSAHCPGCGAPQSAGTNGACEYCGLAQNDGSTDWVLAKVQAFFPFSAKQRMPDSADEGSAARLGSRLSRGDNERLLQCAAAVMMADGVIDPKEKRALRRMAGRRGIAEDRLNQLVLRVGQYGAVKAPESGSIQENREFLQALVLMCLADGNITREERSLIKSLVEHMRYTEVDIDQTINRVRAKLYKASKQVIREQRRQS